MQYSLASFRYLRPAVLSIGLAGIGLGWIVAHETRSNRVTVEIDAFISTGRTFSLYYNNLWSAPGVQAIVPNQWHLYEFGVPSQLTSLRLDPVSVPNAFAQIRSIRFRSASGEAKTLDLSIFDQWIGNHVTVRFDPTSGTAVIHSTGNDAYTMGGVSVDLGSRRLPILGQIRLDGISLLWACVSAGLIYASLRLWPLWKRAFFCAVILAAALIVGDAVGRATVWAPFDPPSPGTAVGHAAFSGMAKNNEIASVLAAISVAVVLAGFGGLQIREKKRGPLMLSVEGPSPPLWKSTFLWVVVTCFALLLFPPLHQIALSLRSVHHPSDFDNQNIIMWEYFTSKGLLPLRDFWFPYSGFYNRMAPFRADLMRAYLHELMVFTVLVGCLYELLNRRSWAILGLCFAFFAFSTYGILSAYGSWRYFLSLSIVLLMLVALLKSTPSYFISLGLWTGYIATQEISQAIMALPSVLALLAAVFLWGDMDLKSRVRRMLPFWALSFGVFMATYLGMLYKDGQLREWWVFISSLGAQSDYSAWPANLPEWFSWPSTLDGFGLFLILLLMAGGTLIVTSTGGNTSVRRLAPLAIGCLGVMILQKQVVRPSITSQFIAVVLAGLACLMFLLRPPSNGRDKSANRRLSLGKAWGIFSCSYIVAAFWLFSPNAEASVNAFRDLAALPQSVRCLLEDDEEWRSVEATFFALDSVQLHGKSGDYLRNEFQAAAGTTDGIFVLGDASYWYLVLDKPAPFYISFYNQSPVFAQKKTLEWLQSKSPQFVIWDAAESEFNGVPNQVRVPLVFDYVVSHYGPLRQASGYLLLHRLAAGETPDLQFWIKQLGDSINLGAIPGLSKVGSLMSTIKPEGHSPTALIMVVHIRAPRPMTERSITLTIGTIPYSIRFMERAGVADYRIVLDRIPIIAAARSLNLEPSGAACGPADCRVEIGTYSLKADTLY